MYSMVLMAALTSGTAAPDWGHHRCGGCHGCYSSSCYGCYGSYGCHGCYGGCSGGWGCSGCYAGYGCSGCSGSGCWGGYAYGCHGCYASTGWGCAGCYGGWSCYGMPYGSPYHQMTPFSSGAPGMPGVPGTGGTGDKNIEKVPPPKKDKEGDDTVRARLVVELPADARLFIDDLAMKTQSGRRVFNTPPLARGQSYYYVLRAEVVRDGQTRTETQRVILRPGEEARASFANLTVPVTTAAQTAGR